MFKISPVFFICSLLSALIIFTSIVLPNEYRVITFLPIIFLLFVINPVINQLKEVYFGVKIIYYLFFIKLVISPLLISFTGETGLQLIEPTKDSLELATLLQVIEAITALLVVSIIGNKLLPKEREINRHLVKIKDNQSIFFLIIIIVSFFVLMLFPSLTTNYTFLAFYNDESQITSFFRGLDIHLLDISIVLLFTLIARYLSNMKGIYPVIIFILFSAIFIGIGRGDNRLQIVFSMITSLVVAKIYFREHYHKILAAIFLFGTIMILVLSYYRIFAITSWRPNGGNAEINLGYITNMVQIYFSGIKNTALGIEAMNSYSNHVSYQVLFSDIFSWSGYTANFISEYFFEFGLTTNYLFNLHIYGSLMSYGDQIIPSMVQSYIHFGLIGSFIIPGIFTLGILYVEKINMKVQSIEEYLINIRLISVMAMFVGYSISSIGMFIFGTYVLWFILFKINRIISHKVV